MLIITFGSLTNYGVPREESEEEKREEERRKERERRRKSGWKEN